MQMDDDNQWVLEKDQFPWCIEQETRHYTASEDGAGEKGTGLLNRRM